MLFFSPLVIQIYFISDYIQYQDYICTVLRRMTSPTSRSRLLLQDNNSAHSSPLHHLYPPVSKPFDAPKDSSIDVGSIYRTYSKNGSDKNYVRENAEIYATGMNPSGTRGNIKLMMTDSPSPPIHRTVYTPTSHTPSQSTSEISKNAYSISYSGSASSTYDSEEDKENSEAWSQDENGEGQEETQFQFETGSDSGEDPTQDERYRLKRKYSAKGQGATGQSDVTSEGHPDYFSKTLYHFFTFPSIIQFFLLIVVIVLIIVLAIPNFSNTSSIKDSNDALQQGQLAEQITLQLMMNDFTTFKAQQRQVNMDVATRQTQDENTSTFLQQTVSLQNAQVVALTQQVALLASSLALLQNHPVSFNLTTLSQEVAFILNITALPAPFNLTTLSREVFSILNITALPDQSQIDNRIKRLETFVETSPSLSVDYVDFLQCSIENQPTVMISLDYIDVSLQNLSTNCNGGLQVEINAASFINTTLSTMSANVQLFRIVFSDAWRIPFDISLFVTQINDIQFVGGPVDITSTWKPQIRVSTVVVNSSYVDIWFQDTLGTLLNYIITGYPSMPVFQMNIRYEITPSLPGTDPRLLAVIENVSSLDKVVFSPAIYADAYLFYVHNSNDTGVALPTILTTTLFVNRTELFPYLVNVSDAYTTPTLVNLIDASLPPSFYSFSTDLYGTVIYHTSLSSLSANSGRIVMKVTFQYPLHSVPNLQISNVGFYQENNVLGANLVNQRFCFSCCVDWTGTAGLSIVPGSLTTEGFEISLYTYPTGCFNFDVFTFYQISIYNQDVPISVYFQYSTSFTTSYDTSSVPFSNTVTGFSGNNVQGQFSSQFSGIDWAAAPQYASGISFSTISFGETFVVPPTISIPVASAAQPNTGIPSLTIMFEQYPVSSPGQYVQLTYPNIFGCDGWTAQASSITQSSFEMTVGDTFSCLTSQVQSYFSYSNPNHIQLSMSYFVTGIPQYLNVDVTLYNASYQTGLLETAYLSNGSVDAKGMGVVTIPGPILTGTSLAMVVFGTPYYKIPAYVNFTLLEVYNNSVVNDAFGHPFSFNLMTTSNISLFLSSISLTNFTVSMKDPLGVMSQSLAHDTNFTFVFTYAVEAEPHAIQTHLLEISSLSTQVSEIDTVVYSPALYDDFYKYYVHSTVSSPTLTPYASSGSPLFIQLDVGSVDFHGSGKITLSTFPSLSSDGLRAPLFDFRFGTALSKTPERITVTGSNFMDQYGSNVLGQPYYYSLFSPDEISLFSAQVTSTGFTVYLSDLRKMVSIFINTHGPFTMSFAYNVKDSHDSFQNRLSDLELLHKIESVQTNLHENVTSPLCSLTATSYFQFCHVVEGSFDYIGSISASVSETAILNTPAFYVVPVYTIIGHVTFGTAYSHTPSVALGYTLEEGSSNLTDNQFQTVAANSVMQPINITPEGFDIQIQSADLVFPGSSQSLPNIPVLIINYSTT